MGSTNATGKAIGMSMILLIMDIKKYFYDFFQRPINFGVLEGVLYWCKYPILTFLDKWRHKIVNSIDQGFRQQ